MIKQGRVFNDFFSFKKIKTAGVIFLILLFCAEFFYTLKPIHSAEQPIVVINEIAWMGTASSTSNEWLELKNNSNEEIDLTGWTLKAIDGTPSITFLASASSTLLIPAGGYFLIERTDDDTLPNVLADKIYVGALLDGGENLELRDNGNNLVDQVLAVTGWPVGDKEKSLTMERTVEGGWQNSLEADGTPKAENSIQEAVVINQSTESSLGNATSSEQAGNNSSTSISTNSSVDDEDVSSVIYDYSNEIIISELLPNPLGNDLAGEFIELFNQGERMVNLTGWKIKIGTKVFEFANQMINPGQYLLLKREQSKLTLNNNGGEAVLLQPLKNEAWQIVKYDKAKDGLSFAIDQKGSWAWTEQTTPGAINLLKQTNHQPIVEFDVKELALVGQVVLFDSSDTTDEDEDQLTFNWIFDDGATSSLPSPNHVFVKTGRYETKLIVSDGKVKITQEKTIQVLAVVQTTKQAEDKTITIKSELLINEIMPNPTGEDADREWLELYNQGSEVIDLLGWTVDDKEGESKPYRFIESTIIKPAGYYLLDQAESNLVLNNSLEEVRLFNPFGELVGKVKYEKAKDGYVYARQKNGQFVWLKQATPNRENIAITTAANIVKKTAVKKSGNTAVKVVKGVKVYSNSFISIKEIGQENIGQTLKVKGVVLVEPGILGAQIFHLSDGQGIQIYNYRKNFPKLKIGDLVEVVGEVSQSNDEYRIKTSAESDIKIVGQQALPRPVELTCDKLNEEYLGQLVKISGEITKKVGSTIYLDDGADEAEVYVKLATGITKANYAEGEQLAVTGIVNKTKSGVRLLPKNSADMEKISQPVGVAGEISASDQWTIAGRDKKSEFVNYLLVIAVGVIMVLIALIIKFKNGK